MSYDTHQEIGESKIAELRFIFKELFNLIGITLQYTFVFYSFFVLIRAVPIVTLIISIVIPLKPSA